MPDFTITVSENNAKIIQKLATQTSVTARQLIEGHIENFAKGQLEGYFYDKIKKMTVDELIALLGDIQ